ncbi:rab GTPase-activating protein 1-like [Dorcoceras hygrometricum]|uniref:Rab GTPase-activating protein 1-like n=1 Tax=Dorcoceras hygrometricum TaxID=472368 RepID=A0A2Z7AE95_9LAMI|nr:rab GTPase-activating protein 1-like [Dorcoceras hygrometricum]
MADRLPSSVCTTVRGAAAPDQAPSATSAQANARAYTRGGRGGATPYAAAPWPACNKFLFQSKNRDLDTIMATTVLKDPSHSSDTTVGKRWRIRIPRLAPTSFTRKPALQTVGGGRLRLIKSTTGSKVPSSAYTIRPDEISTDGNSSSRWPKQVRRGKTTAAAAAAA